MYTRISRRFKELKPNESFMLRDSHDFSTLVLMIQKKMSKICTSESDIVIN